MCDIRVDLGYLSRRSLSIPLPDPNPMARNVRRRRSSRSLSGYRQWTGKVSFKCVFPLICLSFVGHSLALNATRKAHLSRRSLPQPRKHRTYQLTRARKGPQRKVAYRATGNVTKRLRKGQISGLPEFRSLRHATPRRTVSRRTAPRHAASRRTSL